MLAGAGQFDAAVLPHGILDEVMDAALVLNRYPERIRAVLARRENIMNLRAKMDCDSTTRSFN